MPTWWSTQATGTPRLRTVSPSMPRRPRSEMSSAVMALGPSASHGFPDRGRRPELSLQHAVFAAVSEVDAEPDHQPHEQPDPGVARKGGHQPEARQDAQDWNQRHQRRAERPLQIG